VPTADPLPTTSVKIVIAGGFGAGKTTLVGSASETPPLYTEEVLTLPSADTDSTVGVEAKTTTTVAVDFGRRTFAYPDMHLRLYLFGTPGQERFFFLWHELTKGAMGAVILVDTRRLDDSFLSINHFEQRQVPFIVAVNEFENARHRYTPDEIRDALDLPPHVPIVTCDARDRSSAINTLLALVDHAINSITTPSCSLGAPA